MSLIIEEDYFSCLFVMWFVRLQIGPHREDTSSILAHCGFAVIPLISTSAHGIYNNRRQKGRYIILKYWKNSWEWFCFKLENRTSSQMFQNSRQFHTVRNKQTVRLEMKTSVSCSIRVSISVDNITLLHWVPFILHFPIETLSHPPTVTLEKH